MVGCWKGLILCCLLAVAAPCRAADEIIDRVLAVVAGDLIMLSDLRAARAFGLVEAKNASDSDQTILARLIDRALILNEVDRYAPPEPSADAVKQAEDAVRARFPSSAAFQSALASVGLSESQLRSTLRQNLRIRAYLDQRFVAESPERSQAIIDGWIAGLRSRAEILDLSGSARE